MMRAVPATTLSWSTAAKIWWSQVWRLAVLIGTLAAIIGVLTVLVPSSQFLLVESWPIHLAVLVLSIAAQIWALRIALTKHGLSSVLAPSRRPAPQLAPSPARADLRL